MLNRGVGRVYKLCIVWLIGCTGGVANAQVSTTLEDQRSGYKLTLSSTEEWMTDVETGADGITACAVTPQTIAPLATLCVKTTPQVHKLALTVPSYAEKIASGFIDGLCVPYRCPGSFKGDVVKKSYGELSGWELTTDLQLPAYENAGLSGTIFFATVSPQGQLQLFSLHTAAGETSNYVALFESAVKSMVYNAP